MVLPDGDAPVAGIAGQRGQEARRVVGVDRGVEALLHAAECRRVRREVHLQAADVDRGGAGALQRQSCRGGGLAVGIVVALPGGVQRPRPGLQAPAGTARAACLHDGDRQQQTGRDGIAPFPPASTGASQASAAWPGGAADRRCGRVLPYSSGGVAAATERGSGGGQQQGRRAGTQGAADHLRETEAGLRIVLKRVNLVSSEMALPSLQLFA